MSYELTRDIGSKYEYSNLGGGLLGHVLARSAGMDYEALVRSRICELLGMKSTRITLSPDMKTRLASGHNAELAPVPNWDLPTLAGAGALRSSANDMLAFLAANLGYTKSPLMPAMAALLTVRLPTGHPGLEIALGWHVRTRDGVEIVWHNGGTGGYRSFVGFNLKARTGVVVLSNTSISADDIGRHLLDANHALTKPPKQRKEITVDPKLFDRYVGRYQLAPKFILTVTREGDRLFTQATGQPKVEIFPESEREYFLKVVDAQITFETDSQGRATQVILHQGGQDVPGKRIEGGKPPESPKGGQTARITKATGVKVDPKLFDGYVGRYQLAPKFVLTVTREGDRFFTQATGQPKVEIFPESDREYFLKVVDAQLTFETDSQGLATQVILHQNGRDVPGKRIE